MPDGECAFSFSVYASQTGGLPLWQEVQEGVPVQRGSVSISLGSFAPIPLALLDGRSLWLEVGVRGASDAAFTALTPRQQLDNSAQSSISASSSCLHDHFGEAWTGSSNTQGLAITNTGLGNGLQVNQTGGAGVYVSSAGNDGVYVHQAGSPSLVGPVQGNNGFEVAGTEGSGLYVGHADWDGVTVESASWYGLYMKNSNGTGVLVGSAGGDGVRATSTNPLYYGGRFRNSAAGGTGLYAAGGDNTAADLVLGAIGAGDDGRIYSDPSQTGSDLLLFSNDEAQIHLDEDNNSTSSFIIYNGTNAAVFQVDELPKVTVAGPLVTRVDTQDYGPRTAYALQSTGNWYEDFGTTQLVNGMASVAIDPVFAQVVSLTNYHVFLTPLGDCPLYVAEKTPAAFAVRAMGSLDCSIAFDYRIVAERLGNEGQRLEQVVTPVEVDD